MSDINYDEVLSHLNMPNITVAAVKQILDQAGITSQEAADQWAQKNAAPPSGEPGGFSGFVQDVSGATQRTLHDISSGNPIVHALFRGLYESQPTEKKASKKPAAESGADKAINAISNYLTSTAGAGEEAFASEGTELAKQNQEVTNLVDQQFAAAGAASGNPSIAAAMNAYQTAYSTGEGFNSAAYANSGAANAQYVQSAPLQPVLNLLTQGLGSTYYKQLPKNLVQSLPEAVQYALSQAGVQESNPLGGSSGAAAIPTPKGGWPKSLTGGAQQGAAPSSGTDFAQYLAILENSTDPAVNQKLDQTLAPAQNASNTTS
jgi:hypothetical protein